MTWWFRLDNPQVDLSNQCFFRYMLVKGYKHANMRGSLVSCCLFIGIQFHVVSMPCLATCRRKCFSHGSSRTGFWMHDMVIHMCLNACHGDWFFKSQLSEKNKELKNLHFSMLWFATAVAQTRLWNRVLKQPAAQIFRLSLHAAYYIFLLGCMIAQILQCCGSGLAQAWLASPA